MISIIAYGMVVKAPVYIGASNSQEEVSVGFSLVVEEDFPGDTDIAQKKALYRVILNGEQAQYAHQNIRAGVAVLVRGELFSRSPIAEDPAWNHRVVFGDAVKVLPTQLPSSKAYPLPEAAPEELFRVG